MADQPLGFPTAQSDIKGKQRKLKKTAVSAVFRGLRDVNGPGVSR